MPEDAIKANVVIKVFFGVIHLDSETIFVFKEVQHFTWVTTSECLANEIICEPIYFKGTVMSEHQVASL